jgi:hypothetical protein
MNVEIGTETPIFLFWEYLYFRHFVFAVYEALNIFPQSKSISLHAANVMQRKLSCAFVYLCRPGGHKEMSCILADQ